MRGEDTIRSRLCETVVQVIRDAVEIREHFEISLSGTLLRYPISRNLIATFAASAGCVHECYT